MTERKPITADLRRWWELHCRTLATPELDEGLDALCGAIDAVHANLEGESESLRRELDRALGEWDYWESTHVELPKDADGMPVHVGDVMEWPDGQTFEVVGIGDGTLFYVEDGLAEWTGVSTKFHHHATTVEDVLTEFGIDWEHESDCEDRAALLKEYAAKLRLADDGEEQ